MRLNKKDLQKIQYGFNSISNRLIQAYFQDYSEVLEKFLKYLKNTDIIIDYIKGCGNCEWNLEETVQEVQNSYGKKIFLLGDSNEEEVRNVFAVLDYLVDTKNSIYRGVAMGYSSSNQYQDKIKGFNERYVMILIRHIECYLTKIGIDMGIDDKLIYNVTVQNGQAIIASDNAIVTATNQIGSEMSELKELLSDIQNMAIQLSAEEQELVSECLELIESQIVAENPKKGMVKTAISMLSSIKSTTEFGAAVATLAQFVSTIIK